MGDPNASGIRFGHFADSAHYTGPLARLYRQALGA
jgi:hypothetical protein